MSQAAVDGRLFRSKTAYVRAATACVRSAAPGQLAGISWPSTPLTYWSSPSVLTVWRLVGVVARTADRLPSYVLQVPSGRYSRISGGPSKTSGPTAPVAPPARVSGDQVAPESMDDCSRCAAASTTTR